MGNVITSESLTSMMGFRLFGIASVTDPAPVRNAASLVSAAAPVIPVAPAMTKTRP